jgi:hypothetical protein
VALSRLSTSSFCNESDELAILFGKLLESVAVTHNTTYCTEGDATLCCVCGDEKCDTDSTFIFGLPVSGMRGCPTAIPFSDGSGFE